VSLPSLRRHRAALTVLAGAAAVALLAQPAAAASGGATPPAKLAHQGGGTNLPALPSPPTPPSGVPRKAGPTARTTTTKPAAASATTKLAAASTTATTTTELAAASATTPSTAKTWGPTGPATTLVLYDSTGDYGWLGELYALGAGNLAGHFGSVTAEPVTSYVPGQINDYTATVYVGSTYNEPIPAAFLADMTSSTKPVLWAGFNVWQLAGTSTYTPATSFAAKYGWDPATSYLDTTDTFSQVQYKGRTVTRNTANAAGLLSPHITDPAAVSVLATSPCYASDGTTPVACTGIAQSTTGSVPWAIRSANLTYVGEIPLSYINEHDRYLAYADLFFPALAPGAAASKKAAVRLEDVNPTSDPTILRQFADYLSNQRVPFSVGVIPQYTDPKGVFNGGVAESITLKQAPAVVSALKYMQSKGGTIVQHGYTHQYSNVANPYNGVTGDDFEFYRAQCSSTAPPTFTVQEPCQDASWVTLLGALPNDSQAWAANRVSTGRGLFTNAGLTAPTIFETPHYSATAPDYKSMRQTYATRYERELFFGGTLNPSSNASHVFGQFFPYSVNDVYGTKVLPENLGNYEPVLYNNNPPRSAADIVANAAANQVVTQSVASFFFHPDYPLSELKSTVAGIKGLGYTFVAASTL
jgi:uncharacterized protein YdaL